MSTSTADQLLQALAALDPAARDRLLRAAQAPDDQHGAGGGPFAGLNWKYFVGLLGGVALGGGGVAGVLKPETFENVKFAVVLPNTLALLGVAAGVGAVVGLGYSVYHNNWHLALPRLTIDKVNGTLSLPRWGFLDEVMTAVVLAVFAVWAKFPDGPPHQFTEATFALAAGAALAGSRMRSGYTDRDVLRDALAETVGQVAAPLRKIAVENAPTSIAAARAALGDAPAPPPAAPPKVFLDLFDPTALAARLVAHGKRVGTDGNGLTLETLALHKILQPAVKPFVKDMRLPEVAAMPEADFLAAVERNGVAAAEFRPALVAVQMAAREVMKSLQGFAADWTMG